MPEPLEPSTATRSPYQTSRSNGFIRPVSSRSSHTTARLPVRPPLRRILHLLVARLLDRRAGLLELAQPRHRGLVAAGHAVVVGRLLLVHQHQRLELGVLLVPAPSQLLQPLEPVLARLVVRREAARVGPDQVARCPELDGDDPGRGVVQQLAVVADVEDGLVGLADPSLQPDLAGHVEEVVGLVEQQHLVGTGEQVLQHQPLLLATRQRLERAVLRAVVGHAQALDGADVPDDLELVAAGVGVVGERSGVAHLRRLVVGLHQCSLATIDLGGRRPDPRRRDRQQEVGDVRVVAEAVADHLAHHAEPAGAGHRTGARCQLAGDDLQQGGLARPVRADQRHLRALAHAERHVVEQHAAVRQLVPDTLDVDVTHKNRLSHRFVCGFAGFSPLSDADESGSGRRSEVAEPDLPVVAVQRVVAPDPLVPDQVPGRLAGRARVGWARGRRRVLRATERRTTSRSSARSPS